jgi:hypothetical protein
MRKQFYKALNKIEMELASVKEEVFFESFNSGLPRVIS